MSFDFYDDWDEDDEDAGLLGWGNDELDGLLASSRAYGTTTTQPGRQRAMSYGARRGNRRKSQALDGDDPTIIPASSYWGFLGKLTGKIRGGKALRYKPSAADLQEHPGASRTLPESAPLLEEDEEDEGDGRWKSHKRVRSNTQGSGNTTDSLSSRGDIFPSEDELDDAVPLDDEFAMVLERRTTNSNTDETSSGGRKGKRPSAGSRLSTRTMSSRSSRNSKRISHESPARDNHHEDEPKIFSSMAELRGEEERVQKEEEVDIAQKREAAQHRLVERVSTPSLDITESPGVDISQSLTTEKGLPPPPSATDESLHATPTSEPTTPFPAFDPPPMEDVDQCNETVIVHSTSQATATHDFNPAQLPRLSSHAST